MIVDDDPDIRNAVHFMLTKAGYRVVEASDGEDAIARMKSSGPTADIATIICDLQMPKINGAEVIAHLRTHYPTIPFLILTATRIVSSTKFSQTRRLRLSHQAGVKVAIAECRAPRRAAP